MVKSKVWSGLIPTFVEVIYGEKTGRVPFSPPISVLNRVKHKQGFNQWELLHSL